MPVFSCPGVFVPEYGWNPQSLLHQKKLDSYDGLCYHVDCTIVREYTLWYNYAQKLTQTAERTEVKHQWRKTGYVLLQMVKDFV